MRRSAIAATTSSGTAATCPAGSRTGPGGTAHHTAGTGHPDGTVPVVRWWGTAHRTVAAGKVPSEWRVGRSRQPSVLIIDAAAYVR